MGRSIWLKMNIFSVLLLYYFLVPIIAIRSGPYKVYFTRVGPCPSPVLPLDPNPPGFFSAEIYSTTTETNLLRGNVTVARENKVKKMKAKSYTWDGNRWKVKAQISNMGCSSVYFPGLVQTIGLKYDVNTCTFMKGTYLFENMNLNKMQHLWMNSQEYGKLMWRLDVFSSAGTVFCYEFETLIEPSK